MNTNSSENNSRKIERKASVVTQSSSQYITVSTSSTTNKTSNTHTNHTGFSSTYSTENKYKPIPKIKYCKISNIPDTKNIGSSNGVTERTDSDRRYASLNYIGRPGTANLEKRHSIDGSFSNDLPPSNTSISSEKKAMHGSCRNLSNGRGSQPEKLSFGKDSLNYTSWSNKYLSNTTPPNGPEATLEKTSAPPPNKIIKNDSFSLSNDSGSYYERRLKNLEERIQRHKMDINALFTQNAKQKMSRSESVEGNSYLSSSKKPAPLMASMSNSATTGAMAASNGKYIKGKANLNRSKSENTNSSIKQKPTIRYDYTFSEGDRLSTKHKPGGVGTVIGNSAMMASSGGEYGLVTAKELYDLRKSQVIS